MNAVRKVTRGGLSIKLDWAAWAKDGSAYDVVFAYFESLHIPQIHYNINSDRGFLMMYMRKEFDGIPVGWYDVWARPDLNYVIFLEEKGA